MKWYTAIYKLYISIYLYTQLRIYKRILCLWNVTFLVAVVHFQDHSFLETEIKCGILEVRREIVIPIFNTLE